MKDYYRILEIHPEASLEVMNKAYRALVQKYHPDHYHSSNKTLMNERMQAINEAYEVLSNPDTRRRYDEQYRRAMASGGFEQESVPTSSLSAPQRLVKLLWWTLGTFIVLQLLIRPLLASPVIRWLVLALIMYWVARYLFPSLRKS